MLGGGGEVRNGDIEMDLPKTYAQNEPEPVNDGPAEDEAHESTSVLKYEDIHAEFGRYRFLRPMRRYLKQLHRRVTSPGEKAQTKKGQGAPKGASAKCTVYRVGNEKGSIENDEPEKEENATGSPSQESDPVAPALSIGEYVEVAARCWPGINKPGGAGKIKAVQWDEEEQEHLYKVAYILGGSETRVEEKYIRPRDILGDQNTGARKQGLMGRCRYCPSFIRDCGHSQEDRVEKEGPPRRSNSRVRRSVTSSSGEGLISRVIRKQARRSSEGGGDSLARLEQWRREHGLAQQQRCSSSSPGSASKSRHEARKRAPKRFASLQLDEPTEEGEKEVLGSASFARSESVVGEGEQGSTHESSSRLQELSPQQVKALVVSTVQSAEQRQEAILRNQYSPDDHFLQPEGAVGVNQAVVGGATPALDTMCVTDVLSSLAPHSVLSVALQLLVSMQEEVVSVSRVRSRILAYGTTLATSLEGGGGNDQLTSGLRRLQSAVDCAQDIIALSDELEIVRARAIVGCQDNVVASISRWKLLLKTAHLQAKAEKPRLLSTMKSDILSAKRRSIREKSNNLEIAWRSEEDSTKRALRKLEERYELSLGLSPLDYLLEYGGDQAGDEVGGSDSDSEYSYKERPCSQSDSDASVSLDEGGEGANPGSQRRKRRSKQPPIERGGNVRAGGQSKKRRLDSARISVPRHAEQSRGKGDHEEDGLQGGARTGHAGSTQGHVLVVEKYAARKEGQKVAAPAPASITNGDMVSGSGHTRANQAPTTEQKAVSRKDRARLSSRLGVRYEGSGDIATTRARKPRGRVGLDSRGRPTRKVLGAPRDKADSASAKSAMSSSGKSSSTSSEREKRMRGKRGAVWATEILPLFAGYSRSHYTRTSPSLVRAREACPVANGAIRDNQKQGSNGARCAEDTEEVVDSDDIESVSSDDDHEDVIIEILEASSLQPPLADAGDNDEDAEAGEGDVENEMRVLFSNLVEDLRQMSNDENFANSYNGDGDSDAYDAWQGALVKEVHRVTVRAVGDVRASLSPSSQREGEVSDAKGSSNRLGRACSFALVCLDRACSELRGRPPRARYDESKGGKQVDDVAKEVLAHAPHAFLYRVLNFLSTFESRALFSVLPVQPGSTNAAVYRLCSNEAKISPVSAHASSFGDDGDHASTLAGLLYTASVDPLHDKIVGNVLFYLERKLTLLHGALQALTESASAGSVNAAPGAAVSYAASNKNIQDLFRALDASLSSIWDDLSAAILVNPLLISRTLNVMSRGGPVHSLCSTAGASSDDNRASQSNRERKTLSFRAWYASSYADFSRAARATSRSGNDVCRTAWLAALWYRLCLTCHQFSQAASSTALKAKLAGASNKDLTLNNFRSAPWQPLTVRLSCLLSGGGLPVVGQRLHNTPLASFVLLVAPGGSSNGQKCQAPAAVNPFVSYQARMALESLQRGRGDNTTVILWTATALHTMFMSRCTVESVGSSTVPRVRNNWHLLSLLLSSTGAVATPTDKGRVVTQCVRRMVALSARWDECAEGIRIFVQLCQALLTTPPLDPKEARAVAVEAVAPTRQQQQQQQHLERVVSEVLAALCHHDGNRKNAFSLASALGAMVAGLFGDSGLPIPPALSPAGATLQRQLPCLPGDPKRCTGGPAHATFEGHERMPSLFFALLRHCTTNVSSHNAGTGFVREPSKIMLRRAEAALRKKECNLVSLLTTVRDSISKSATSASLSAEGAREGPAHGAQATVQLMLSTRGTTVLLLLAAAVATIGKEVLTALPATERGGSGDDASGGSAAAQSIDALGAILPWGEGEEGNQHQQSKVSICKEHHACLLWLLALVVYHPLTLGTPEASLPSRPGGWDALPKATKKDLDASLLPLMQLLRSLPLILESELHKSSQNLRDAAASTTLPLHSQRQLLIALGASSALLSRLTSAVGRALSPDEKHGGCRVTMPMQAISSEGAVIADQLSGVLKGDTIYKLVLLGLRCGPPRTPLGVAGIRSGMIALSACDMLLQAKMGQNDASASTAGEEKHAMLEIMNLATKFQSCLLQCLSKLVSGGDEASPSYDLMQHAEESHHDRVGALSSGRTSRSDRRGKHHLHALAADVASRAGKWCATLTCHQKHHFFFKGAHATSAIASVVRILSSLPQHDSPVPQWLLAIFWSPILQTLHAHASAHPQHIEEHFKHVDTHLVSLHCSYVALLATAAVLPTVLSDDSFLVFERSLRACSLLLSSKSSTSAHMTGQLHASTACKTFWQSHEPVLGRGSTRLMKQLMGLAVVLARASGPLLHGKTPMQALCSVFYTHVRFVNQLAFHADQVKREASLLPWARQVQFMPLLGCSITLPCQGTSLMAAVPSLQTAAKEEHLVAHEEGAGLRKDIALAAVSFGEALLREVAPPMGARDMLQYLPLLIRTTASRQYATAYRAWRPLLSMLLLSCSARQRWRPGERVSACDETLAAWALSLLPGSPTGRRALDAQKTASVSSVTKQVMNRTAAGLGVMRNVYRCGCAPLVAGAGGEDSQVEAAEADGALQKLASFTSFLLFSADANEKFRSDTTWREIANNTDGVGDQGDGGGSSVPAVVDSTIVATKARLLIYSAALATAMDMAQEPNVERDAWLTASSVYLSMQLLRVVGGSAPSAVDCSCPSPPPQLRGAHQTRVVDELVDCLLVVLDTDTATCAITQPVGSGAWASCLREVSTGQCHSTVKARLALSYALSLLSHVPAQAQIKVEHPSLFTRNPQCRCSACCNPALWNAASVQALAVEDMVRETGIQTVSDRRMEPLQRKLGTMENS